jgi:signal transduction histidine kinase
MKEKALQVLLVEDNAGDARLLREMLRKEKPGSFNLTHLQRISDAEMHLANGGVDIVLLDMGLPDEHGLDSVRRARTAGPDVPIIVLTGMDDEVLAAEAMKEGAQDYLIKGQIENRALPRVLRHAIERHRMVAETDRIRKQQSQLKNEFLSHVSHELRSPLTSIYSFTTIIADGLAGPTSSEQDEYLQIIVRNVQQLQAMIEDLLEVTQTQTGKLSIDVQCVSVSEAISHAIASLHRAAVAKDNNLASKPFLHPFSVFADPTRLRQILTILCDNAIKFTPAGGTVQVRSCVFEKDHGFVLVEVSDTGVGIKPEVTERIFDRLYQVTDSGHEGRKGLGLGLYIAKDLVIRQGGNIWVISEPQIGSHFFFTLPICSLVGLIRPILMHDKGQGESIAMLAVEIHTRNETNESNARNGPGDVPMEILDMTRKLLQQCLRPNTDLLLPNLGATSNHKIFFVVAYTQEQGAEIIGKRIETQLHDSKRLQPADFRFTVSSSFLMPTSRREDESMDTYAERVAAGIQDRMDTISLQGSIQTWVK